MVDDRTAQDEVVAITGSSKALSALMILIRKQAFVGKYTRLVQDHHEGEPLRQRLVAGPSGVLPQPDAHGVDSSEYPECRVACLSGIEFTHDMDIVKPAHRKQAMNSMKRNL